MQMSFSESARRWLTIQQAADYLSVHRKTLYDWAARGIIPTARIGGTRRVDRLSLDQDLERQVQAAKRRGKRP